MKSKVGEEIVLDNSILDKLSDIANKNGKTTDEIVSDLIKNYTESYTSKLKTIICNDFSLSMLDEDCKLDIKQLSLKEFNKILTDSTFECCIGNKKIADNLGLYVNKKNISLNKYTRLIVAKPINDIVTNKSSDLKFKFFEIKYEGMWSYDWINNC